MGIPRVRTSIVCVHNGKLLTFQAEDPTSKALYLFLPGGKVEPEETAPEAGERETFEETGFQVIADPKSSVDREYSFHWDGKDYDCLTLFYWARLQSPLQSKVEDASYNQGVIWLPLNQIKEKFSYSTDILSAVEEILQQQRT